MHVWGVDDGEKEKQKERKSSYLRKEHLAGHI